MNKDQAEDCYIKACIYGNLDPWMPIVIDEEFDIQANYPGQGVDKINYFGFMRLCLNLIKKDN